ncbi:MAG: Clp protease N-terminal domain-containing protein, partial [Actinobacteria bacterium]|nr:Clp protease N-terminal domain-containing protein [Actinomycetota bacterium]
LAGQDKIHSEHLLIGLLSEPGPAADALAAAGLDIEALRAQLPHGSRQLDNPLDRAALASLGIDLDAVRRATDATFGRGALDRVTVPGRRRLPFAEDAKHTLTGGVGLAVRLKHRQITSGHLLLGILDQPESGALNLLRRAGADVDALRADVMTRISAAA